MYGRKVRSIKKVSVDIPKITNGSMIEIGEPMGDVKLTVDQHLNWFQKKMMKWCFGFKESDYSEE